MTSNDVYFPTTGMPDKDWWHALWPRPAEVISRMGIERGISVVDICCGDAYFTAPMARSVYPGRVIAIDLDAELLDEARIACEGLTNCSFVLGDVRELTSLVPSPVDYAFIANTFHGVPNPTDFARNVVSILNPGGRFGVVNWHAIPREQTPVFGKPRGPKTEVRMTPALLREVVEPAGFALERVVDLPPFHYGSIFVAKR